MTPPTPSAAPTIRTFQVFPDVPAPLQPLLEMAQNLWWVWHPDAAELFRREGGFEDDLQRGRRHRPLGEVE